LGWAAGKNRAGRAVADLDAVLNPVGLAKAFTGNVSVAFGGGAGGGSVLEKSRILGKRWGRSSDDGNKEGSEESCRGEHGEFQFLTDVSDK
jgi:hypothetical protein